MAKNINAHFGTVTHVQYIPQRQFCLPKIQEMRSAMTFSLPSARIVEPSLQGLISSSYKTKVARDILRLKYNFRKALTPLWQLHVNVNLVQYIMYAQ